MSPLTVVSDDDVGSDVQVKAEPTQANTKNKARSSQEATPLATVNTDDEDAEDTKPPEVTEENDKAGGTDDYPWAMWKVLYEDIKLEEHPTLIHEICVALQTNHVVHGWQLKQAPKEWIQKIFPMESHMRHQLGVL